MHCSVNHLVLYSVQLAAVYNAAKFKIAVQCGSAVTHQSRERERERERELVES